MREHELIILNSKKQQLKISKSRPFLLAKVDGKNVSANIQTSTGNFNGVRVDSVNIKERTIPIEGAIVGMSKIDMERKRAEFIGFLNPSEKFEFIYTNHRWTRKVIGYISSLDFQEEINRMQKFQIQVLVPFPFWEEPTEVKNTIAAWTKDAYFPLVATKENPIIFGHRVSNIVCTIYNIGDVATGMRIRLEALATVENPSVLNIYTREFIKIKKTLEKGDVLEISTKVNNKRVEIIKADGSRENVLNWMTFDSEFLQLQKGDNVFRYDAESGIDNLEMSIYYTPAYLGI